MVRRMVRFWLGVPGRQSVDEWWPVFFPRFAAVAVVAHALIAASLVGWLIAGDEPTVLGRPLWFIITFAASALAILAGLMYPVRLLVTPASTRAYDEVNSTS